jgi:hypothetical protein
MNINQWGPRYWEFLHIFSIINEHNYDVDQIKLFFDDFHAYIPCLECREHYTDFFKDYSHTNFVKSVLDLHNSVNQRLQKVQYSMDELRNKYEKTVEYDESSPELNSNCKRYLFPPIIFICILVFIVLVMYVIQVNYCASATTKTGKNFC